MTVTPLDHRSIGLLGVLTICTYGSWYYSFGVLIEPIVVDTGWRESTLAASFSSGSVLVGLAALAGGRLLDRVGHRVVFLLGAMITTSALLVASWAPNSAVFFVGAMVGLGASGALGFYHVTMPTAVRLNGESGQRAITVLTIWGAFASAIFLPITAWLVNDGDWRSTIRVLAVVVALAFLAAAFALPSVPPAEQATEHPPIRQVLAATIDRREARLFTLAVAFGGIAMSTMLVYQVPSMTSLGLSAGTAASIAGFRGFCQLLGRVPLTPIVNRLGLDGGLLAAFGAMAIAGLLLASASSVPVGLAFAVVAGFGIGAFSPLQGMKSEALFARTSLGATMGIYGTVLLVAGSIGPVLAGVLIDATGERRWAAAIVVVAASLAVTAVFLLQIERRHEV